MTDETATTAPLNLPADPPKPSSPPTPGWKTSEFYAAWFVKILGALMASGLLGNGEASRVAGGVMALLAQLGYTGSRTLVKTAASAAMVLALVLGVGGASLSGCAASTQQTTIKTSIAAVDTTRAAFYAYDRSHREQLRAAAKTPEELAAAVTVWLKEESMVLLMLQTAYRGIAVYSTLKDDPPSFQNLNSALGMLAAEMAALGVHP